MPGERAVPASDVQTGTFYLTRNLLDASGTPEDGHWFYCEKDTILEGAWLIYEDADGAGGSIQITKTTGAGQTVANGTNMLTAGMSTSGTADTTVTGTIDEDNNLVPAGSWIALEFTATTTFQGAITIRVRTQIR